MMNELKMDINIWIVKNLNDFISTVTENIKKFRFNDAIKKFILSQKIYCDWYIEAVKIFHE